MLRIFIVAIIEQSYRRKSEHNYELNPYKKVVSGLRSAFSLDGQLKHLNIFKIKNIILSTAKLEPNLILPDDVDAFCHGLYNEVLDNSVDLDIATRNFTQSYVEYSDLFLDKLKPVETCAYLSFANQSAGSELLNLPDLQRFKNLCECILLGVINQNVSKLCLEADEKTLRLLQENLGVFRAERYRMLAEIDDRISDVSNFDTASLYPKPEKYRRKTLKLPTVFEGEAVATVKDLRKTFNQKKYPKNTYGLGDITAKYAVQNGRFSFNEKPSVSEKEINLEALVSYLKGKLSLLGYSDEEEYANLKNVAVVLYDLVLDPNIDENIALENYKKYYEYFILLGEHNNEVELLSKSGSNNENGNGNGEDDLGFVTPSQPESSVKTSASLFTKVGRGTPIEKISDIFRTTVLVDKIFEDIDVNVIMENSQSEEEYMKKLRTEKRRIFGYFYDQKLAEYESLGYKLAPAPSVKIYDSGYVDGSIYLEKIDSNGNVHKFEVQLQSEATLKAKEKETAENNKRKSLQEEAYSMMKSLYDVVPLPPPKFRKFIEKLFLTKTVDSDKQFEEIKRQIKKLNPEFEVDFDSRKSLRNLAEFTFAHRNVMKQSLRRSKIWFAQESFLQTKADIEELRRFMPRYGQTLDARVSDQKIDLSDINPNFSEIKQTTRVVVIKDGKILLLYKAPGSKRGLSLELPGGGVDKSEIEKVDPALRDIHSLEFQQMVNGSAFRELEEETGINAQNIFNMNQVKNNIVSYSQIYPYSYTNPTNNVPTDVNLVIVNIPKTQDLNIQTGRLSGDNHLPDRYEWVAVEDYLRTVQEGGIYVDGDFIPYNGNTLPPEKILWKIKQQSKT